MSICLCNLSADTVLELAAQRELDLEPASTDTSTFEADQALAEEALGTLVEALPRPIELLVGDPRRRRRAGGIACHVWKGPVPMNGFLALDEGVYVTSPEFTLLQQASQLHQVKLCQLLGRYLGTWTPKRDEPNGQDTRAPLTTFEALGRCLSDVANVRGTNNLRLAMAYTCEGAASAPETALQLALSLPPELHGLGIEQPIMNYEVSLSSEERAIYDRESIRIDLCWPQRKFGLEYQGSEHGDRLGQDYARFFAARNRGYELWFVAKDQLQNAAQMRCIGHEVARRIGVEVNDALWPSNQELQELLDTLAGLRHPRPMSYEELRSLSLLYGRGNLKGMRS